MQDGKQLSLSEIQRMFQSDYSKVRKKFFRPDEGMKMYRISRPMLIKLALDAGALYKIGRCCLIHVEEFDAYFEHFKVPMNAEVK